MSCEAGKHEPTCDADLCRPLGGPIQHSLLGRLQVAVELLFSHMEHLQDDFEDLRAVLLPDLHALLHGHDDVLGLVLRSVLGALLHGPWIKKKNNQKLILKSGHFHISSR